ncbi:L,D-transpeptidase family protein [Hyphomicrobium sp. 99]|uniref:L,D-transpeptidase family protein n=1 Tax=Hyphomicrobium sp. 99 TaxID=1163419 RepID=UPI0005F8510A|nr:L,D-transpeptidase family protein [Hyphomicrobium sp. 99]
MFRLHPLRQYLSMGLASMALVALASTLTFHDAEAASRRSRHVVEDVAQDTLNGQPVMAIVSIKDQRVTIYDAAGGTMRSRVSSGRTDYETPVGVYSVLQKEEEHYSNVYDDASMPFMQRITWSGVALHGGALPGYPASHGCVRLPESFAQRLYPLTKVGMRVIVAYDDVAPVEITHPLLLKPTPQPAIESAVAIPMSYQDQDSTDNSSPFEPNVKRWPARLAQLEALKSIAAGKQIEADAANDQADQMKQLVAEKKEPRDNAAKALRKAEAAKKSADDKVARADKGLAAAKSPKAIKNWEDTKAKAIKTAEDAASKVASLTETLKAAEAELQTAMQEAAPVEAARAAAVAQADEAKHKTQPVSIFISLKTQRLYVRQGYEPVFEAPVTISEPETPIGTHVYTAVDYTNDGNDLRWTAVTLEHKEADYASSEDRLDQTSDATETPQTDVAKATAALNRITIAPDVLARVTEAAWPGSSLIISDEPMSKETAKATDFIVLVSTEPQGGIRKRPKQFFPSDNFYRDSSDDFYYNYDRYGRRQMYPRQKSLFWW